MGRTHLCQGPGVPPRGPKGGGTGGSPVREAPFRATSRDSGHPLPRPLGGESSRSWDIPLAPPCPSGFQCRAAPGKFPGPAAPRAPGKFPWLLDPRLQGARRRVGRSRLRVPAASRRGRAVRGALALSATAPRPRTKGPAPVAQGLAHRGAGEGAGGAEPGSSPGRDTRPDFDSPSQPPT